MTPPDPDLVRIRHLQEAAQKAIDFSQGKTRQSLDEDELLRLALTKLIEIVGTFSARCARGTHTYWAVVTFKTWAPDGRYSSYTYRSRSRQLPCR
jgi:uncharacterized protein with HEPN domain